jgi:phospholipid/cholesterol/gamma-HCH transport system substrate-binding protein
METRAPYALIGFFVLAAIGAVFGFVYWLNNTGGLGERTVYRVRFENTVSGLLTGAAVLFDGIRVGEVTRLQIDADNPRRILATIAVVAGTPVRADTKAGLEYQGLTGVPVVSLIGGASAEALAPSSSGPPIILADPEAGQSVSDAARQALRRIDDLIADNAEPLKSALSNLDTFTTALARNSDRVDGILAGLERMTAAAPKPPSMTFDLTAPTSFPPSGKATKSQLVVLEPSALISIDTRKIAVTPGAGEIAGLDDAQWSDNIPKLVQEKIIQTLENSDDFGAVARPLEGLNADNQLALDIRSFDIAGGPSAGGAPGPAQAHVAFTAKVLGDNGRILGSRIFDAKAPVQNATASGAAAAFNEAFAKAATELAAWTAGVI